MKELHINHYTHRHSVMQGTMRGSETRLLGPRNELDLEKHQ